MASKKWQLLKTKDISPSPWFPLEKRTYKLPNGDVVDDFYVTTLADVVMIVPNTKDGKVVMVRQFKAGFDDVIIEFPAGRIEPEHKNNKEAALHELEEETGIKAQNLTYFGTLAGFVTKASEKVYCFIARDVEFNSEQNLDRTEDIDVLILSPEEVNRMIEKNEIQASTTVAAWQLAKKKILL